MKTDFHAILRKEARELSREEIDSMSWDAARVYYYAYKAIWKARRPKDTRQQVCFTGFTAAEKDVLVEIAAKNDLNVMSRVTVELDLLVCGPNAGPAKLEKATKQGVAIIAEADFRDTYAEQGAAANP